MIFALFFTTDAYSAYSCPTYKEYTSCNAGYYLNGTGAGNSCSSCPSGCTCAGGTAAPVCCTNTCTSTNNTTSTQSCTLTCSNSYGTCTCQNSGTQTCNGKYTGGNNCTGSCTGCSSYGSCSGTCNPKYTYNSFTQNDTDSKQESDTQTASSTVSCSTTYCTGTQSKSQPQIRYRTCTRSMTRTCTYTNTSGAYSCGSWSYGSWSCGSWGSWQNNGSATYGTCTNLSCSCSSGYYLSGTSCPACGGNKWYCPGNNNYYDVSAGYYTTGGTSTTRTGQTQCPAGTYCTNGEKNNCDSGYTSAAGATARTQCYRSCSVACTQQTCPANATCTHGTTSTSGTQYYGGACNASSSTCSITITCNAGYYLESGACKPCNGNQWYCPGDNNWYTVSAGYYSTGGTSTTRTGQAECTNATYCSGGVQYDCPDGYTGSDNGRTSIHDCFTYQESLITCKPANAYSGTGWDYYDNNDNGGSGHDRCLYTVSKCKGGYYLSDGICSQCPTDFPLTDPRGEAYSEETALGSCWRDCNISDVPNSTERTGWKEQNGNNTCKATKCAAGYYLENSACKPCSGNQWYCPGDNNWYTVSAGYYSTGGTATTRTGQSQCTGATYCSSGVQYNCPDEYTANTTAGKTANTQCTINVGSGNYIATKNSTTTTPCPDGTYMGAHTVAYGTTSECAACPNGYPYSDNGRASAHDCWTRDTTLITCKPANAYSGTGWDYYDNNDNGGSGHDRCLYTVSKCQNGYYLTANTCTKCPADFPLTDPRTADYSDEKSIDECWRDCNASDVPNSTARTGWKTYGGSNNCAATACADKYSLTTSNICAQLCTTGITHIKIGSLSIPLYSARQTTPAINVRYQDAVCYGSLADGNSTDSLNLKYSGKEYHTIN